MQGAEHFIVNTRGFARSMPAEACLLRLAGMGFRQFEIALAPGHLWPGDVDAAGGLHFRRFVAGQRLSVASLDLSRATFDPSDVGTLDIARRAFDLAAVLDVAGVVVGLGRQDPRQDERAGQLVSAIAQLAETAANAGIALWIAGDPSSLTSSGSALADLMAMLGDTPVGAVLDVDPAGEDIAPAIRKIHRRLKSVRIRLPWRGSDDRLTGLPSLLDGIGYAGSPSIDIAEGTSDAQLRDDVRRLVAAGLGRPRPAMEE